MRWLVFNSCVARSRDAWPTTEGLVSVAGPGRNLLCRKLRQDARFPRFLFGRAAPFQSGFLHITQVFELPQCRR